MKLDLADIKGYCEIEHLPCRVVSSDELRVTLADDAVLCFVNLPADKDTAIGFDGTPWHCHDSLIVKTARDSWVDLAPTEILAAWLTGDLLLCTRRFDATVVDRWLVHRTEPQDLQYAQPGESLTFETSRTSRSSERAS